MNLSEWGRYGQKAKNRTSAAVDYLSRDEKSRNDRLYSEGRRLPIEPLPSVVIHWRSNAAHGI